MRSVASSVEATTYHICSAKASEWGSIVRVVLSVAAPER